MKMINFLNVRIKLFDNNKKKWSYVYHTICFVVLFVMIYEPFGISNEVFKLTDSSDTMLQVISIEVLAILLVVYISKFIWFKKYYRTKRSLKKHFLILVLESFTISMLFNCLQLVYIYYFSTDALNEINEFFNTGTFLDRYPFTILTIDALFWTPAHILTLSYPFVWTIVYSQITDLKKEVSELENELSAFKKEYSAEEVNNSVIDILDENNNVDFSLCISQILAIESNNQYVLIYYLEAGELSKKIIRTRLKKILSELSSYPIYQSHRSYAVNLLNVKQLTRKGKKSVLIFSNCECLNIPVSKSYLESIKDVIN